MVSLNILYQLLSDYIATPGDDLQDLYYELVSAKPIFRALFDVAPRSESEKKELQSGKAKIGGRELAINPAFASEAIFLANSLDVSEFYAAEIIESIMQEDPNLSPERRVEKAVHILHSRRSTLVACIQFIATGSRSDSSQNMDILRHYAKNELFGGELVLLSGGRRGGLGEKLLDEMDRVQTVASKVASTIVDARSDTNIQAGTLGRDILQDRHRFLVSERLSLAFLLYTAARYHLLSGLDISKLLTWTSENPPNDASPYILCSILTAINPLTEESPSDLEPLFYDPVFLQFVSKQLANETRWKAPYSKGTKALLQLAWELFGRRALAAGVKAQLPFSEETVEDNLRHAIENDAFQTLLVLVSRAESEPWSFAQDPLSFSFAIRQEISELLEPQQASQRETLPEFFKHHLLETARDVVLHLIGFAPSVLKSVRTRQEDLVGASARTRVATDASLHPKPRRDISVFFVLIAALYSSLPLDSALVFWEQVDLMAPSSPQFNFSKFLRWSVDVHDKDMTRAMFEMIAGLCTGKECSEMAYNFLSSAGVSGGETAMSGSGSQLSWRALFRTLDMWTLKVPNPRLPQHQQRSHNHQGQQPPVTSSEIFLLSSFLSVLRTIVSHSTRARLSLYSHSSFKILPCLISLIPCHVPLELKANLFDTISAFCKPGAGVPGVEICKAVWTYLEEVEILGSSNLGQGVFGGGVEMNGGVAFELEEVEVPAKRFPSTLGFVRLLATLIHAPRRIPLAKRILQFEPIHTVPDNLGAPRRLPGVIPYTHFVINKVLLPTFNSSTPREYLDISDKWAMIDVSLSFVENALASYGLDDLLQLEGLDSQGVHATATRFLLLPGFGVLHEMLTDSPLVQAILSYLNQGAVHLENSQAGGSSASYDFQATMLRVLRIIHRVLEIQDLFIDILCPVLSEMDTKPFLGIQFTADAINGLDQRLVWTPDHVVSIASFIVQAQHDELNLMAIRTLRILSGSPAWTVMDQVNANSSRQHINRLAIALDRSANSEQIMDAFVRLLNQDAIESITETDLNQSHGAGAPIEYAGETLTEALRWEILDLLLDNTTEARQGPNLAHLLLGYSIASADLGLEDPHATGARASCLHVILNRLGRGVRTLKESLGSASQLSSIPALYETNPVLSEKCYRLVFQLCTQDLTRDPTMRYLRTHENFFVRQLSALPSSIPVSRYAGAPGVVHYGDQTQVPTTCEAVTSFLRLRSCLIEATAQEVHLLTRISQNSRIDELLGILFRTREEEARQATFTSEALYGTTFFPTQALIRIVELFYSFDFDWEETDTVEPVELVFYRSVNLMAAVRPDVVGCELIDRDVLMQMLQEVKLQSKGELVSTAAQEQLQRETSYILMSCTIENHRRQIQHAKGLGLDSWRRLLEVCLAKCFDRLTPERRDALIFDLLGALPNVIVSGNISAVAAVSLSETVVTLTTKLREDWNQQIALQSSTGPTQSTILPTEKMHSILKSILECVLDPNSSEFVRGNLYAALINYLHLIEAIRFQNYSPSDASHRSFNDFTLDDSLDGLGDSQTRRSGAIQSDTELETLAILNLVCDRLVQVVSRDANDGSEVWKSVAFALLDCLVRLSRTEKRHYVLVSLVKQGFLNTFVWSIRDIDGRLDDLYSPDPGNLNSLFVYEAKMSLLIRIAQTRQGAERLMESRLFGSLGACEYISAKPELDGSAHLDRATYLPNAIQRYHQLLLPALQLIDSVLASVGFASKQGVKQAVELLMAHRETFVLVIRDNSTETSLSMLREQQLLVSFCAYIYPTLDRGKLGPTDFGPLHTAILTLGARCLKPKSRRIVRPTDDAEVLAASTTLNITGKLVSSFDLQAEGVFEALKASVITYLGTSSHSTASDLRRVLSPVSSVTEDEPGSTLLSQPSIDDVIFALSSNLDNLSNALHLIETATHKLTNQESVSGEDITKIVNASGATFVHRLTTSERRTYAFKELERIRSEYVSKTLRLMYIIEVALLLIWRHIEYYQSGRHLEEQLRERPSHLNDSSFSKSWGPAFSRATNLDSYVPPSLLSLVTQIEHLSLPVSIFGRDSHSQESYLRILCRKLRETVSFARDRSELSATDSAWDLPPY